MKLQRRFLLIAAPSFALSAFVLSACSGLIGPPDAGALYTMRPVFPAASGGPKVAWALSILRPDASGALDSDRIALMRADGTMDYYAAANYSDSVPDIVQRTLLDGFEASGRIDAVAREQDALHADYNLVTEIKDFEARYAQNGAIPTASVIVTAKLTTAHGRKIVASTTTSQSVPASADSAAASADALSAALGAATTAIVSWALTAAPPNSPGPK